LNTVGVICHAHAITQLLYTCQISNVHQQSTGGQQLKCYTVTTRRRLGLDSI